MATTQDGKEREIEFKDLEKQLNGSLVLIDVREPKEIEKDGKIPTSINIPLATVKDALNKPDEEFRNFFQTNKPHLDDKIVFHCHAGKRAAMSHEIATELGFKNVWTYKGSFSDWLARGGAIERK